MKAIKPCRKLWS